MAKKKSSFWKWILWLFVLAIFTVGIITGYRFYKKIYTPNISIKERKEQFILIPTGSTFGEVKEILINQNMLIDSASFSWVAKRMKYRNNIKPGRYLIKAGMSNKQIISLLRSGEQTPVDVSLNNIHTKLQLAESVSSQIEASSGSLMKMLNDTAFTRQFGLTPENSLCFFIPNTYQIYWNTSATQFINRMKTEYNHFWTNERKKEAVEDGLTRAQVAILASIVQMETGKDDEKPTIAGVYINRLKKGWPLQADPTVIYAVGDFSLRRVFSGHREIDSPYNTYKYKGLPPGPICLAATASLDAVLHYTKHNYMYFCAKDDFSGYHAFAVSDKEQQLNAQRYHAALDRKGIR